MTRILAPICWLLAALAFLVTLAIAIVEAAWADWTLARDDDREDDAEWRQG